MLFLKKILNILSFYIEKIISISLLFKLFNKFNIFSQDEQMSESSSDSNSSSSSSSDSDSDSEPEPPKPSPQKFNNHGMLFYDFFLFYKIKFLIN